MKLARINSLMLKCLSDEYVSYKHWAFHKTVTDGLEWLWIIVMLLSTVWTLVLMAPIHCRWSQVSKWCSDKILQICPDEETN